MDHLWERFKSWLALPVDAASLAFFRIAVGLVMALEAFSLVRPSASTSGRVMLETYYTGPEVTFNLPYAWFEWLPFLAGKGMYAVVAVLGIAGITVALGFFYRVSAALVFMTWGYLYAVEATRTYWMSYYYLELLITFLLIWMPSANKFSIDAWRAKPGTKPKTVPYWTIVLLRAQLAITYFYAGLAKLNADWLLDAVPMRDFLARSQFLNRAGMESLQSPTVAYVLSYAGALFDLSVGGLLLWPRTRILGLLLLLCFHGTNHFILFDDIVWFPLLGALTATIFLDPDWPEKALARFRGEQKIARKNSTKRHAVPASVSAIPTAPMPVRPLVAGLFLGWIVFQSLLPARHYLIPGDGRFTWEGLSFSWRLKAEIYRSVPCEIFIDDRGVVSRDEQGLTTIHWNQWNGEKVIYRTVKPGEIQWAKLPEIFVTRDTELGDRIFYNLLAGGQVRSEAEARSRLAAIWQERYGRTPSKVQKTISTGEIVEAFAAAVRTKGGSLSQSEEENLRLFISLYGARGNGKGLPTLRRLKPFVMEIAASSDAPLLLVEDDALFQHGQTVPRIRIDAWRSGEDERYVHSGGNALVLHVIAPTVETRSMLPAVCLMDSAAEPEKKPAISWDYLRDTTLSKAMHIATNPFLLQRYAERVAELWQKQYGRRPGIRAITGVSLNGRPPQTLVDPDTDLASVGVSHFRHNAWIKDLELARIPRESVTKDLVN